MKQRSHSRDHQVLTTCAGFKV